SGKKKNLRGVPARWKATRPATSPTPSARRCPGNFSKETPPARMTVVSRSTNQRGRASPKPLAWSGYIGGVAAKTWKVIVLLGLPLNCTRRVAVAFGCSSPPGGLSVRNGIFFFPVPIKDAPLTLRFLRRPLNSPKSGPRMIWLPVLVMVSRARPGLVLCFLTRGGGASVTLTREPTFPVTVGEEPVVDPPPVPPPPPPGSTGKVKVAVPPRNRALPG